MKLSEEQFLTLEKYSQQTNGCGSFLCSNCSLCSLSHGYCIVVDLLKEVNSDFVGLHTGLHNGDVFKQVLAAYIRHTVVGDEHG